MDGRVLHATLHPKVTRRHLEKESGAASQQKIYMKKW